MHWRLTATTLFCNIVRRWVPIVVYKDGRTNCGYFYRHRVIAKNDRRELACHGPQGCSLCEAYKEDLFSRADEKTSGG
jgi:thioredoxin-related protein